MLAGAGNCDQLLPCPVVVEQRWPVAGMARSTHQIHEAAPRQRAAVDDEVGANSPGWRPTLGAI